MLPELLDSPAEQGTQDSEVSPSVGLEEPAGHENQDKTSQVEFEVAPAVKLVLPEGQLVQDEEPTVEE